MTQEDIANEEEVGIIARQSALVNHKVTDRGAAGVQVQLWSELEDVVAELEANGLEFRGRGGAALGHLAEGVIGFAVQGRERSAPLLPQVLEDCWRHRELRATRVDDGGVGRILARFLHGLRAVVGPLSFKRPGAEPVLVVLKALEATGTAYNLR